MFVIIRQIMEWDRRIDPLRGESMYLSLWPSTPTVSSMPSPGDRDTTREGAPD